MDREEFYEAAENRILTVFPQRRYHHNAYIIGGRKGLEALRDALNEVLAEPEALRSGSMKVAMAVAHPGDDEVNSTFVILDYDLTDQEDGHGYADDFPLPYYDKNCVEQLKEGAVSLSPPESHIMEAGIKNYLLNKSFDEKSEDSE